MAGYIEIKVGAKTFHYDFPITDAKAAGHLERFASSEPPVVAADATLQQKLDDAGMKIVKIIMDTSRKVLRDKLANEKEVEINAIIDAEGLLYVVKENQLAGNTQASKQL